MIFTHIHKHRWQWTPKYRHGERIGRCVTCGDEAYGLEFVIRQQDIDDFTRKPGGTS